MLELKKIVMVGLGGALGSIARYKVGSWIFHRAEATNFPWSTFMVNLAGCLVMGVLAALAERHDLFSPSTRIFLFTGLLGGFTTYSAFAYESAVLMRKGLLNVALAYMSVTVLCCLTAVWAGLMLVSLVWPTPH